MPEWSGHLTILAAISNTGKSMPPAYIWDGEDGRGETGAQKKAFDDARLNHRFLSDAVYAHSGRDAKGKLLKGTMTKELWRRYFLDVFLPHLSQAEKPALLIIDGHASHFDLQFMLECQKQGVDVVQEPANCSSVLQALDQVCFQVLKKKWRAAMKQYVDARMFFAHTLTHIPHAHTYARTKHTYAARTRAHTHAH